MKTTFKLDYSLKTVQERIKYISALLDGLDFTPNKSSLERMTDYIFDVLSAKEQKQMGLLSKNTLATIQKRETSFEGLAAKFEDAEDSIQNQIATDKNTRLVPKKEITQHDIETVPGLKDLRTGIEHMEQLYNNATGKRKFLLKKHIIMMRQEQYILKSQREQGSNMIVRQRSNSIQAKSIAKISLDEHISFDKKGEPVSDGKLSLFNKYHIIAILNNYSALKQETECDFSNDLYYLLIDFDRIAEAALKDFPLYEAIVTYKIDGLTNIEISNKLQEIFGCTHTPEYISNLFNNKIPKLIAEQAKEEYLIQYQTTIEKGNWKKCSRCGQIKLAHSKFFSKNKDSKDGFYSICKKCRNKKRTGDDLFNGN